MKTKQTQELLNIVKECRDKMAAAATKYKDVLRELDGQPIECAMGALEDAQDDIESEVRCAEMSEEEGN